MNSVVCGWCYGVTSASVSKPFSCYLWHVCTNFKEEWFWCHQGPGRGWLGLKWEITHKDTRMLHYLNKWCPFFLKNYDRIYLGVHFHMEPFRKSKKKTRNTSNTPGYKFKRHRTTAWNKPGRSVPEHKFENNQSVLSHSKTRIYSLLFLDYH